MLTVLDCILGRHDLWLVLLAAALCLVGSWATMRVFRRAAGTTGLQRAGWQFLTMAAAGSTIWCTHFIAMLAYDPGASIGFDPSLTVVSLLIAMIGSAVGFVVATGGAAPVLRFLGGALVGMAIVAMHYTGMLAYRVEGTVDWNMPFLVASVVLAVLMATPVPHFAIRQDASAHQRFAAGLFALATITLHFTGMAAFSVTPAEVSGQFSNPEALQALAYGIAAVATVIVSAGLVSYLIDDSTRAESDLRLQAMALRDHMTDLPNRAAFNDYLAREIEFAGAAHRGVALVALNLNGFKEINDRQGLSVGDKVLRVIARRLRDCLQEGEFVARLNGDEFAVIVSMPAGPDDKALAQADLSGLLARLEAAVGEPVFLLGSGIRTSAGIGVAFYPEDAESEETLVANALLALYRAKSQATDSVCFYDPTMAEAVRQRRALASDLLEALQRDQFELHYQVQVCVASGEVRGYEALLRWQHPELGSVPPSRFIPIAEENGFILELGEWVLRTACAEASRWRGGHKVAVNLSPVQVANADIPKLVHEVLMETGLPPARLELELTETTLVADTARSQDVLQRIKALGVSVALDDFGTGHSSLGTLSAFPFDKIKLDRSFIGEIETRSEAKAVVRAVVALGRILGITVLAEGVETPGQLAVLAEEECDEAQGFLLGMPVAADRIEPASATPHEKPRVAGGGSEERFRRASGPA